MALINIEKFAGLLPISEPEHLPDEYASDLLDCDLERGSLAPVKDDLLESDPIQADTQAVYFTGNKLYQFDTPVTIAKNLDSITSKRIIVSGDGYPKEVDAALGDTGAGPWPAATRRNGLPAPEDAPGLTLGGSGSEVQGEYSWVYTYYFTRPDGTVIESAPSPPSAVITVNVGETVTLSAMAYPSPAVSGCTYTGIRIYRLYSTENSSLYHFVHEQTNVNDWLDNVTDAEASANAVLETMDMSTGFPVSWDMPVEALKGIILTDFGFFVGYSGNDLYFSVLFVSYAFPGQYSLSTDSEIVGIGYTGSVIVVLTKANPCIVLGQNPASVSLVRQNYVRPCIGDSRSIISTPAGVIFPSKEGMILINNTGAETLLTDGLFTEDQWQALNPETFTSFLYQKNLVCFEIGTRNIHIFKIGENGTYEKAQALRTIRCAFHQEEDQQIYIVTDDETTGRELRLWRGGTAKDYFWESKVFDLIPKASISRANIKGDFSGGTVSLTMVKDGVDMPSITVSSEGLVNLGRKLSSNIAFKLSGQAKIKKVFLGRSPREVLNV